MLAPAGTKSTWNETPRLASGLQPSPGFRLIRLLGSGSFGEVWEAATQTNRRLALKFLPCDARQRAAREIRALQAIRQLRHPHLIQVEGVWCFDGYIVVAMELADGSLLDLQATYRAQFGTPVVAEHSCLLLYEATEALDFLNSRQHMIGGRLVAIQHCDIKPSNLLMFGEHLKVADFGLSSVLASATETRCRAGTLDYCAPEIFRARLTSQSDQYSLAVTYCMIRGGRLPFPEGPAEFSSCYHRPKPDLTMLSERERPVVARALNPVPPDRWPSCCEFVRQLTQSLCM